MHCNLPGSSVRGVSQAGILGWVAISFSNSDYKYSQTDILKISTNTLESHSSKSFLPEVWLWLREDPSGGCILHQYPGGVHTPRALSLEISLEQQSPALSGLGTHFVEDNLSMDLGGGRGWLQDDSSALHLLCAPIVNYISFTSDHQVWDLRGWVPCAGAWEWRALCAVFSLSSETVCLGEGLLLHPHQFCEAKRCFPGLKEILLFPLVFYFLIICSFTLCICLLRKNDLIWKILHHLLKLVRLNKLFTSLGKELNHHAIMVKVIETSSWCNVKQRKLSDSYY